MNIWEPLIVSKCGNVRWDENGRITFICLDGSHTTRMLAGVVVRKDTVDVLNSLPDQGSFAVTKESVKVLRKTFFGEMRLQGGYPSGVSRLELKSEAYDLWMHLL